jgi:hypothetical protein
MNLPARRPSKGIAFTNWLVSRTTRALERGTSRRGFLVGSAMVGSAVAVGVAIDWAAKPGSAYNHITDCASGFCTDGYTEFCCAVNNGFNACPPDSFPGGWWRADSSSFCAGGTRYYIDCMQFCCGPPKNYCQGGYCFCEGCQECRCAGDCNTRRVYCNYFRYGQCHQEIPTSGPIACRVVSCVPPYNVADNACSPAPAVDNSTAEHAANCSVNIDPPTTSSPGKGRTLVQLLIYGTLNCFYVGDNGALVQKAYNPSYPGSDANGWVTISLTGPGVCKVGEDVDAQSGFQGNVHIFAKAADGQRMVHLTFLVANARWVTQIH